MSNFHLVGDSYFFETGINSHNGLNKLVIRVKDFLCDFNFEENSTGIYLSLEQARILEQMLGHAVYELEQWNKNWKDRS